MDGRGQYSVVNPLKGEGGGRGGGGKILEAEKIGKGSSLDPPLALTWH